jgi:hypothetical protein
MILGVVGLFKNKVIKFASVRPQLSQKKPPPPSEGED